MSGYSGGGASLRKKTLKVYTPRHYSAKEDIDRNLATLRNRAADLVMNSPVGCAAVNTESTHVIGAGLNVFPRIKQNVLGVSAAYARDWSRKTKAEFELWAENAFACDYLRRNNFNELQQIAFESYLTEGDSFCLFKRRSPTRNNPYSLRLQLIEAQRVSNPLLNGTAFISNVEMTSGQHRIVNGVEVDRSGTQVAIWVSNRIWNEPTALSSELKWQRVRFYGDKTGCRNVLHICRDERPEQFRGVPLLAPVIETLKQISRYGDAELSSAIVKSFFSVFFVQPVGGQNYGLNETLGEEQSEAEKGKPCVDVDEYKLGSATIAGLPAGVDVKAINSSNAQSTFEPFMGAFLKQVGAAINIPYEVLLKNFTASYSASRAALQEAANEFRRRKAWFINDFLQPIYEMFLMEAVAIGRIEAAGFFEDPRLRAAWLNADWINETNHSLDPLKEAQAIKLRLDSGLSTYRKELAENGGLDFDDVVETLSQERALINTLPPFMPSAEIQHDAESEEVIT